MEGASLVFTVFNQRGTTGHYSGMAIIRGKDLVCTENQGSDKEERDGHAPKKEERDGHAPKNFPLPVFSYCGDSTVHAEIIERAKVKESKAVDFLKQCSDILKVCE